MTSQWYFLHSLRFLQFNRSMGACHKSIEFRPRDGRRGGKGSMLGCSAGTPFLSNGLGKSSPMRPSSAALRNGSEVTTSPSRALSSDGILRPSSDMAFNVAASSSSLALQEDCPIGAQPTILIDHLIRADDEITDNKPYPAESAAPCEGPG